MSFLDKKEVIMEILKLGPAHADEFCRLRMMLFEDVGEIPPMKDMAADLAVSARALADATKSYYLSHIDKDLVCFGIEESPGRLAASAALCLFDRLPYMENLSGREGYVLSVYTCPKFRKQGMADKLMAALIQYGRNEDLGKLWLNSSPMGKNLYFRHGFKDTGNEMELML